MGILGLCVLGFLIGAMVTVFICSMNKPVEKDVMTAHCDEMIKVITAYKEGYPIEFRMLDGSDNEWYDVSYPSFNFGCAIYRIKEEKKVKHIDVEV